MANETIKSVRLGDVFDLQMGKTPARADSSFWGGGHKWISIADIGKADVYISETKETISDAAISASGIRPIPKDTLIMSFKLSIGKVAITAEEMFSNEAIMSFRDLGKHELDLHYLFHQFKNKDWSGGMNKAVMGATLNKASLKCHEILLHPLAEQKRIAAALDKICEMKRNAEARLQKLDLLVKARFSEMFGDVGVNPYGFPIETIKEICESCFWIMPQTPRFVVDGDVRYITSKNIRGGRISFAGSKMISHDDYAELVRNRPIMVGDFLISMIGTLGEVAIVKETDGEFYGQNMFLLRINSERIDARYLFAYLTGSSYVQRHWNNSKNASTQSYLKSGHITGLKILIPPLACQRSFAAFVEKVEALKATAGKELEKVDLLYRAKLQEYFG